MRKELNQLLLFCLLIILGCEHEKILTPPRPEGWIALGLSNVSVNRLVLSGDWLYACAGKDGLFRTKRSAATEADWQYLGLGDLQVVEPGTFGVIDVVALNDTIVAGVLVGTEQFQTSGIYRSVDDGNTWVPSDSGFVGSSGVVLKLAQSPLDPRMLAAGCIFGPKVYISKNFGGSWIAVFNFAPDTEALFSTIGFHPRFPDEIWAGGAVVPIYSNPILFRSTDSGETWNDVLKRPRDPNLSNRVNDIAFDPEDEQTVYACMNRVILKTIDSGNSWTLSDTLRSPLHSLSLNPSNNQEFIAGAFDTLYHSLDGMQSWTVLETTPESVDTDMRTLAVDWQKRILYVATYSFISPLKGVFMLYF